MFNKLRRLFKSDSSLKSDLDLSLGYARFTEFKTYLESEQFSAIETNYTKLTWDEKTLVVEGICINDETNTRIMKWIQQSPDSLTANLFAGVSCTHMGWLARSGKLAQHVSEDAGTIFMSYLNDAYNFLKTADAIQPKDAEVCARMIRVLMGLNAEEEVAYQFFNDAKQTEANHLIAHLMMINFLTPKWHGSIEKMHEFADYHTRSSTNSLLITLKLVAITEEWLYYGISDETEKQKEFFSNPSLKQQILTLHSNYKETEDGKLLIPIVRNYFSFLLYQLNEKELARKEIKKMNGQLIVYPWGYMGVNSNVELQAL